MGGGNSLSSWLDKVFLATTSSKVHSNGRKMLKFASVEAGISGAVVETAASYIPYQNDWICSQPPSLYSTFQQM